MKTDEVQVLSKCTLTFICGREIKGLCGNFFFNLLSLKGFTCFNLTHLANTNRKVQSLSKSHTPAVRFHK